MESGEYEKMNELQKSYWWYRGRRFIVRALLRSYSGTLQETGRFLDVGCGTGEGASIVADAGRLTGIDESKEALTLAEGKGYAALCEGKADRLPFSGALFQGALALDVLEHVEHDQGMLEECFRVLASHGLLFLTVPAYSWLWSEHDEVFGHKRRYKKNELVQKAEKAGFEILFSSYYVMLLLPAIAIFRLTEKIFRNKHTSHFFHVPKVINAFLFSILAFEGALLRLGLELPFGSSLVLVARKP